MTSGFFDAKTTAEHCADGWHMCPQVRVAGSASRVPSCEIKEAAK